MGNWLDRWARSAAGESTTSAAPRQDSPADSRRSFLKKAAVVTGAAWSVPVLQTAVAPAASASPGNAVGQPCTNPGGDEGAQCGDGSRCHAGVCGSNGAICGADAHCISQLCVGSTCIVRAPGGACTVNANCQYGNCINGVCGGVGATCSSDNQCANGRDCSGRSGGPTTCGGPGAGCSNNSQCTYGNCSGGTCGNGSTGGIFGGAAACGTPNGSWNAPGHDEACETGFYCKGGWLGLYACRSTTP